MTTFSDGFDPWAEPIRDAATVMLVRDGDDGLEVFMLRRTMAAVFAGGLYVFPGGRVDRADGASEYADLVDGLDDAVASERLGLDAGGLAFYIGAIRECFEEAGVLLATAADGSVVRFEDPATIERFEAARHEVHGGTLALSELCRREGLRLIGGAIGFTAHWLTPIGERRRFDTRFFLARAPEAQTPLHDDQETIESFWIRPTEALERSQRGDLALLPPTAANLRLLTAFATATEALDAVHAAGRPTLIRPKARMDRDGRFLDLFLPDDPRYAAAPELEVVDT